MPNSTPLRSIARLALPLLALSQGCDDDEGTRSGLPYLANGTVVIGASEVKVQSTPSGQGCITLPSGACVRPQSECGEGAYADVLLDGDGDVIETVCLPVDTTTVLVDIDDGVAELPDNGAVIVLDSLDRQADILVTGNRGTIYGASPAEAVIDGDLVLRGNESTVRGVTVTGSVTFEGNASNLYHCVIHGDVILQGNENLVSHCTIFGSILSSGNEDRLHNNFVGEAITVGGAPRACRDNRAFDDVDADLLLDDPEVSTAAPLVCDKK